MAREGVIWWKRGTPDRRGVIWWKRVTPNGQGGGNLVEESDT